MTKKKVEEVHIFDQVQKELEDASKCPVAHIDYSGDGGAFGFHAILVNARFAILVNQAGILVTNKYLAETSSDDCFEVTGFDMENLFPVWELDKPIAIALCVSPPDTTFKELEPWSESFYTGTVLEEWPSSNLVVEDFKEALKAVRLLCEQLVDNY